MDFDEDAPPDLVEAGDVEDEENIKVPITIVTGVCHGFLAPVHLRPFTCPGTDDITQGIWALERLLY